MKKQKKKLITLLLALPLAHQSSAQAEEKKPEVPTTHKGSEKVSPTGLRSKILLEAPATAKNPTRGQRVTVNYTGWLDVKGQKGKKFDSSVDKGKTFSFIVGTNSVIKGWEEAIKDMKVGEKREVYIPANLAYGLNGIAGVIPQNAPLIFEIELLSAA